MNRVSSYTDYKGNTIQYGYDELGNVITLTYAGGEIVRYAYYPNGLLKSVTDVKGSITSYEYDSKGNVTKTVFADGTVENCEYNALGYVTVQETKNAAGALLSRYEYAYDERGNVVTATGMDFGDNGKVTEAEYKYDAANRLISYNGKEVQYDKDGNMTYGPLDGKMVTYEYDCRNRLVKAGDTVYEYDAENNRIAVETEEYREEYVVNPNAQFSQILTAIRYEKESSGHAGSDNSDSVKRHAEKNGVSDSGTVTVYTYGNGLVSQYTEESDTEYYHYNNIGSTMYLTKNGVKTHEFAYSTYGELTKGGYGEVRFMYNGRLGVVTDDNGLYYMRARYYNPEIRRFINQDIITGSIENSQSLNRYAYCQGNPVNYLDPFGLSPQSFGSWAGHTVLNLLSFVPVFGNAADAFNAIWYAYEGNYAEAIACAVGAIPLIGNLATGFKIGSKVVKGCNIAANGGKAAIGFYNGVQNVMNVDRMIRTGTGRWYDCLGQGVQFGLNMFVSAVGVSGAWSGISNLVGELNYNKMQSLAQEVSWKDIDGGAELDILLGDISSGIRDTVYVPIGIDGKPIPLNKQRVNGQDIPLPDPVAEGRPHTVLGGKISSETGEVYRQLATFHGGSWPTADGFEVPISEVHWTDHARADVHTCPHQHVFIYDFVNKYWYRSEPEIF